MEINEKLRLRPTEDSVAAAAAFVEETLQRGGLSPRQIYRMNVAADEMYSNIVRYSGAGNAEIRCAVTGGEAVLCLKDDGAAFNPLLASAPDTTLSAEDREIGGLGILMARRLMTRMEYRREGGQNVLTMALRLT